ncbi:MAG: hypothetical protein F4X98_13280 [Gammaproteobacteria bacterium]|nr:hypothetical protein [Gammaproteobacteria bacterium]
MVYPNKHTPWSNERGYQLTLPGEGWYQDLYSPRGEIIASIFDQLGGPLVQITNLADGLVNNSESHTNAAEACDDLANQHFNLTPWRKRIFQYVLTSDRARWLVLVVLAIIGIVASILS